MLSVLKRVDSDVINVYAQRRIEAIDLKHDLVAVGARTAAPAGCGITRADIHLFDGMTLSWGDQTLRAMHTAGSMCYVWKNAVFTGDTLLINGCGHTDFQSGSAQALYNSITQKLFTLPDRTVVYPGHDYRGFTASTIGLERSNNSRVAGQTLEQFVQIMDQLDLPRPQLLDVAVPANQNLGQPHGV